MTEAPELDAVIELLRDAVHSDARGLTDDESCERAALVEKAGRLIDALRVQSAADLARRSRPELGEQGLARRHGCRTAAQLLERITRVSGREAARRAQLGSVLAPRCALDGSPLPAQFAIAGAAVEAGEIGTDAAWAITRALGQAAAKASPLDLEAAEESLVTAAHSDSADLVAVQARLWREALDPDGAEPREEELRARRELRLGREVDGMTPFHGWADPTSAALMRAAVSERTSPYRQPRFVHEGDPDVDCEGLGVFGEDRRTRPQKTFDAFIGLLQAGIRADAQATGSLHSVATVNVVVSLDHLVSGVGHAFLDDVDEAISAARAQEIACDAGYRLHITGRNGEPLFQGDRRRFFTAAQRRSLAVRDGGCVWPQCTSPPSWTHAHHVIPVSEGGPTDVDNGTLLCPYHHHLLHRGEYRMRMNQGLPELLAPRWIDPDQVWRAAGRSRLRATA
ncbi:HNH endonuclease signature motif containing protein [Pseudolysinimonas yzui]|uniref:HNH endonuclease n=1 Tax=Pseudolysinimonas yzui TaxID=2708254 RepID=A0A8J3DYR1_9MICO|nr:HNH endonuclease signature motif containing protein [Pseudolysinimonas yzui]GHF04851.1 HNH endonuclease [Pseudolysinimonas yzui]